MTIADAYESLKAIDPRINKVSEQQHFPPYEHSSSFDYFAYIFDGPTCVGSYYAHSWEDLISEVRGGRS